MPDFEVLESAIDPNNRITFLLDWELTMKCNLDCDYCFRGLYGGHDNSTQHPPLEQCLSALDFMLEYADIYVSTKPKGLKYVTLNVYGGESLHHPDIIEILEQTHNRYEKYKDRWKLIITTTTNAILPQRKLKRIIPYIDYFMVSYHTNNTDKQKNQFKENLLLLKQSGKSVKCIILMHNDPVLFQDSQNMIDWCNDNGINYFPKQLDHSSGNTAFDYDEKQVVWFKKHYQDPALEFKKVNDKFDLADSGRTCCGGRQLCLDGNRQQKHLYVQNKFTNWYCSVNEFFLYVKQVTGEIFVNKDCKMNYQGQVGPIGHLPDADQLLKTTKKQIKEKSLPVIQCKKQSCFCGLCAPKAKQKEKFNDIMRKYRTCDISSSTI